MVALLVLRISVAYALRYETQVTPTIATFAQTSASSHRGIPNILYAGDLLYGERRPDTQGDGEQQRVETG